jgi:hypothetical protein
VLAVGGLDRDNHDTMDYELWGKLFLAGANFQYTDIPFGMFRKHPNQNSRNGLKMTESLLITAAKLALRADCISEEMREKILSDLDAYNGRYKKSYWKGSYWTGSGRLAKLGLPPSIVNPIRKLRAKLQK